MLYLFVCSRCGRHRDPHSFPTRRSSDLAAEDVPVQMEDRLTGCLAHVDDDTVIGQPFGRCDFGDEVQHPIGLFRRKLGDLRSEEHTSELQSLTNLVCRLLLEKKKITHQL